MTDKTDKAIKKLMEVIARLDDPKEAADFFRDLCTLDELRAMAERWQIVLLLDKGLTYREIAKELGSSTTTVSRVSSWLNNGAGGYRLVLDKISHHNSSKIFRKS